MQWIGDPEVHGKQNYYTSVLIDKEEVCEACFNSCMQDHGPSWLLHILLAWSQF